MDRVEYTGARPRPVQHARLGAPATTVAAKPALQRVVFFFVVGQLGRAFGRRQSFNGDRGSPGNREGSSVFTSGSWTGFDSLLPPVFYYSLLRSASSPPHSDSSLSRSGFFLRWEGIYIDEGDGWRMIQNPSWINTKKRRQRGGD